VFGLNQEQVQSPTEFGFNQEQVQRPNLFNSNQEHVLRPNIFSSTQEQVQRPNTFNSNHQEVQSPKKINSNPNQVQRSDMFSSNYEDVHSPDAFSLNREQVHSSNMLCSDRKQIQCPHCEQILPQSKREQVRRPNVSRFSCAQVHNPGVMSQELKQDVEFACLANLEVCRLAQVSVKHAMITKQCLGVRFEERQRGLQNKAVTLQASSKFESRHVQTLHVQTSSLGVNAPDEGNALELGWNKQVEGRSQTIGAQTFSSHAATPRQEDKCVQADRFRSCCVGVNTCLVTTYLLSQ